MRLIINIDDETYADIKKGIIYSSIRDVPQESVVAIANGTPLPEGHGRLIDADAFIKEKTEIYCENCDRRRGMKNGKLTKHFVYDIGDAPCRACDIGDMIDYVDDAPTIIDREGEGEDED